MHVPPCPGPVQAKKEKTKIEELWNTSFLQGALNELYFTIHQILSNSILSFSSEFNSQINWDGSRETIVAAAQCLFPSTLSVLTVYVVYNYNIY